MRRALFLMVAILLPVISAGLSFSCQKTTPGVQDGIYDYGPILDKTPIIRVLIVKDVREAQLAIYGCYQVTGSLTNIIDQGQGLQKSLISLANGGINIGNKHYGYSELRITSLQDGGIELNNVRYRGEIRVLQQQNSRFSIIGELDLESFVASVIGSEMPQSWNEEALKAQAVTARTYAIYKKKVRRGEVYHLDSLELAYRGASGETAKTTGIVQETKGIIMVYDWNVFPAYFHSTCGGHTEDICHVFGKSSIPPLGGVVCNYCSNSKYASWSTDISKASIEKRLREANVSVSDIQTVNITDPGHGNHGSKVEITAAGGIKEMNANEFRLLIGPNYLYSTAFHSRDNGKSITFSGRGWGHGVGMCQYGARTMAEKGIQWTAILKYYYPKIELVRIY